MVCQWEGGTSAITMTYEGDAVGERVAAQIATGWAVHTVWSWRRLVKRHAEGPRALFVLGETNTRRFHRRSIRERYDNDTLIT